MTGDSGLVEQLKTDYRQAAIDQGDMAMLVYVEKLTLEPWNMTQDDVFELRQTGFSDAAILDIAQVAGYYAFVNRLADGLGVGLEGYWEDEATSSMGGTTDG